MKYSFDLLDREGIRNGIEEMLRNSIRNAAYYDGDPEQGGKRVSRNESEVYRQMIKLLEEVTGLPFVPTDDAEQMKLVRHEYYLKQLKEYTERRQWNSNLVTNNEDIEEFKKLWLSEEKKNIDRWISETPKDRPEVMVEINKYNFHIDRMIKYMNEIAGQEIQSHCTSENFKCDIKELCSKCPLVQEISSNINVQIIFQAQQQKEILTDSQFLEYCNAEIKSAQEAMMETSLLIQQDKDDSTFRSNRIKAFIWNKERIKALNNLQINQKPVNEPDEIETNITRGVEVEIHSYEDPAKFQRGVTEAVNMYQTLNGKPLPYKHPFLWHTKWKHPNSSPYVLEVNKDDITTNESGEILEKNTVPLNDEDIDIAFIQFITTCRVKQIGEFLTFQFDKYYNSLRASESEQPFFQHIIHLIDVADKRNLLYKAESDEIIKWFANNSHYKSQNSKSESSNISALEKKSAEATSFSRFEELFFDSSDIAVCVDALRKIDRSVIDHAGHWIGRRGSKSILVAWIDRLEHCRKIRRLSNRRLLVSLLNVYFPQLNFGSDARLFGERNEVYDHYTGEFAALILP